MKLIKDIEVRYNMRVKKILEMDMQMGLYTGWNSDVSGMCREMLGCMLEYFRNIPYVQIKESNDATGVHFEDTPEEILTKEEIIRYKNFPEGWHVININTDEMNQYKKRVKDVVSKEELFHDTVLEQYQVDKKRLEKVLFQYGLMHVFYHEYGHAMDGHNRAIKRGALELTNFISKALEWNADIFAVNQMCIRFYYDNLCEIRIGDEIRLNPIRNEMALMALAVYIFLDRKYDRDKIESYNDEIDNCKTHMAPFLRQYYITGQFAGIWKNYIGISEQVLEEFNQEVMWYIDAYERSEYGSSILKSPFFMGENTAEISKAQRCWNENYEKLFPFISPSVGIGKTLEYNPITKKYEEYKK